MDSSEEDVFRRSLTKKKLSHPNTTILHLSEKHCERMKVTKRRKLRTNKMLKEQIVTHTHTTNIINRNKDTYRLLAVNALE